MALIALAGVVVVIGLSSLVRVLHPVLLVVCCLAMAAGGVLMGIQLSRNDLFPLVVRGGGALNRSWGWSPVPYVAVGVSLLGAAVWIGALIASRITKQCPDCAERVRRDAVDCPYCGYGFALPVGLKRCDNCRRPVNSEARVCRYCHRRLDEVVSSVSSGSDLR